MESTSADRDQRLEEAVLSYLKAEDAGDPPDTEEFLARYPADLAEELREFVADRTRFVRLERFEPAAGRLPEHLGEYRLLRLIGEGGMGAVYEAVQESLNRHVALKVLPAHLAVRGQFLERFRREARAAGRLHHNNIVPVFGTGECGGVHYYVMQYIAGQGLDKVIADLGRRRDPAAGPDVTVSLANRSLASRAGLWETDDATAPGTGGEPIVAAAPVTSRSELAAGPRGRYYRGVARLGEQVADALAHGHGQGILHRDIK